VAITAAEFYSTVRPLCAYPLGDPRTQEFRFCGSPDVVPGKSYCAACHAIAYEPKRPATVPVVVTVPLAA
jgi:hypothetical protein